MPLLLRELLEAQQRLRNRRAHLELHSLQNTQCQKGTTLFQTIRLIALPLVKVWRVLRALASVQTCAEQVHGLKIKMDQAGIFWRTTHRLITLSGYLVSLWNEPQDSPEDRALGEWRVQVELRIGQAQNGTLSIYELQDVLSTAR